MSGNLFMRGADFAASNSTQFICHPYNRITIE